MTTIAQKLTDKSVLMQIHDCGFFINFILFYTLHNCISFAKYQNESATGINVVTQHIAWNNTVWMKTKVSYCYTLYTTNHKTIIKISE